MPRNRKPRRPFRKTVEGITPRQRYHYAYMLRNLIHALEFYRQESTYPIGFGCEDREECHSGGSSCFCEQSYYRENVAAERAVEIINKIINDVDWQLFDMLGEAWGWKNSNLDAWGRPRLIDDYWHKFEDDGKTKTWLARRGSSLYKGRYHYWNDRIRTRYSKREWAVEQLLKEKLHVSEGLRTFMHKH